jgi:hypothetical protein
VSIRESTSSSRPFSDSLVLAFVLRAQPSDVWLAASLVGRARVVGEEAQRGGDCVAQLLRADSEFGATGSGAAPKQSTGAVECLAEVASLDRGGRRRCRLDDRGRALREDLIEVCAADPDATADADRWESALIDPVAKRLLGCELHRLNVGSRRALAALLGVVAHLRALGQ